MAWSASDQWLYRIELGANWRKWWKQQQQQYRWINQWMNWMERGDKNTEEVDFGLAF